MNDMYRRQVALLIRVMPLVFKIKDFAVHGGTAINLFHRNLPRYSVDIDITYIPIKDWDASIKVINSHLSALKASIEKAVPGIHVIHKTDVRKLLCTKDGTTIKIEVNGIKRGILGDTEKMQLCEKAKAEFGMSCFANIVSWSQLYGGKIAAALSRQHPRDLFDCRGITSDDFGAVKNGFMLCLLGSDKPIIESLNPNPIDQQEALDNQFEGMTDEPFNYDDYQTARLNLLEVVNQGLTDDDKAFLISFEDGNPDWSKCCAGDLSYYPSVRWKLQNIAKLKSSNPTKHEEGIKKLVDYFNRNKS
ncbi:nucleotidyl transferase AbiEii/AbiGii toxin family protein [Muribaculaceae bacterium Isolate-004 (NCI)]|uniref:nucleotidyl transferase AbiEii/AbiGii toxin family protein n=1 Tax=uncultured Muribaculum sp. TaxID=1918613 RepID=UPI000FFE9F9A|nr:nucleotidyl transferase AbiEii/AbiGii toxin family protein [uncultured Muribaculum sp.]RXE60952.1 nucleotidyl transferase AbiEii/AbiGii toxin family protein [Muribaculaceae bacterium Isolate-004 (NCI)]RXE67580.1 nucleotidyl transferase AbiEii/AbiGii toxin family protein [Muribaculaceae bacterium Isolate-001 (NCI)]